MYVRFLDSLFKAAMAITGAMVMSTTSLKASPVTEAYKAINHGDGQNEYD
jgi:hypothetical protein